MNCTHCNHEVIDNYCSNCGQAVKLKRIDKHYISHEVLHLLHFEKGFFYTVKELLQQPGDSIKAFITTDRTKHMKPLGFLILSSLLYTLVAHYFHADEIYNSKEKIVMGHYVATIQHWIETHYGYANILQGGFIALCTKLLYRKYPYNYFEITVLLCFVMGQGMLLLTIESFFVGVLNTTVFQAILIILAFAYPTWAIGQFYDKRKVMSYVKAFFAYLFGYLLFTISWVVIGVIIDLIARGVVKH